jgi:hypothetical protein
MKKIREIKLPKATDLALSLKNETEDAKKTKEFCEQFKVENNTDLDTAVKALAEIQMQYTEYEQRRKEQVQKILDVVQDINSFYQPALDALTLAKSLIKEKVAEHVEVRLIARDQTLAKVEEAEPENREALINESNKLLPPKISGLSFRENWSIEIIDEKKAIQHFLKTNQWALLNVNKKAVTTTIKAANEDLNIPGIIAKKDRSVIITPKRVN